MAEKVIVFIDGSYMFHASQRIKRGWKIDYHKLVTTVLGPSRTLVRVYFYTGIAVPPPPAQVRFHQALKYLGFSVVTKPLRKRGEVWVEKGVEVALVTDLIGLAIRNAYDTAILVSGDSDYMSALDEVKRLGKRVEVAAFESDVAPEMKVIGDRLIMLERLMGELTFSVESKTTP